MALTSRGQPRLALSISSLSFAGGSAARGGHGRARPGIALTIGDPAGVGPELVLRVLADPALSGAYDLSVVGDRECLTFWADRLSLPAAARIVDPGVRCGRIEPGRPSPEGAAASLASIETAASLCMSGTADAMVTAPVSKAAISSTGRSFTGHTEFLAELTGASSYVMTFIHGQTRIALATTHLPLSRVASELAIDLIVEKLVTLDRGLRDWFGLTEPRIAVCALNPHAGEGGAFGDEEGKVISPAIDIARTSGVSAHGPLPADSVFVDRARAHSGAPGARDPFDATLAMYHDQGTIAAKLLGAGESVNVTLGLPIVRTSVDHGTAFDIAGRGRAATGSMAAAVRLAGEIAARARAARNEGRAESP
ncbi:MAG: 4-hydroxythreonine-4-phosphate dehydrogenase PdxA [Candidatus Eisenbacteria bacterium]|nr:4-hydroxythreonine-4-phosphate dehydrogenase PdxA [Candidatus Eisenbacteria bacterium]